MLISWWQWVTVFLQHLRLKLESKKIEISHGVAERVTKTSRHSHGTSANTIQMWKACPLRELSQWILLICHTEITTKELTILTSPNLLELFILALWMSNGLLCKTKGKNTQSSILNGKFSLFGWQLTTLWENAKMISMEQNTCESKWTSMTSFWQMSQLPWGMFMWISSLP